MTTTRRGNRLQRCFEELRERRHKAFVAYLCAGDPSLERTVELVVALGEVGVDVIELGIPYSDPMADGPAIQAASERALAAGASVRGVLEAVAAIRRRSEVPLLLFTYLNPLLAYGVERFGDDATAAGVDGVLLLDLPPEEDRGVVRQLRKAGLANVCLVAPNTEQARRRMIAAESRGFVYYVCRFGVTGERSDLPADLGAKLAELRGAGSLPVCVGFGISNPQQAAEAARHGDGVVVGSHLVRLVERHADDPELVRIVAERAGELARAVHSVAG